MSDFCVIGTGMAGFGAAHKLREAGAPVRLFDSKPHFGGHTASFLYESKFTFDEGPHVSFTKHERLQKLFAAQIDEKYEVLHTKVNNYWKGHWIKHPAQVNLHGLPTELIVKVIADYRRGQAEGPRRDQELRAVAARQFRRHLRRNLPDGIHHQVPHHRGEEQKPRLDRSASLPGQARGIPARRAAAFERRTCTTSTISATRATAASSRTSSASWTPTSRTSATSSRASTSRRRRSPLPNGAKTNYQGLATSVPLPDLVPMIKGAPREVLEAAAKLACTEVCIVNLVIDRPNLLDAHWTYIYDRDIFFTRLSTPASAVAAQRAARPRQHPGRVLLLAQVPAAGRDAGRLHRAHDPRSQEDRRAARRPTRSSSGTSCTSTTPT